MTATSAATSNTTGDRPPSDDSPAMREQVEAYVFRTQDAIVSALEALDPQAPAFKRDSWVRAQGGQGRSCVFAVPASSDGSPAVAPTTVLEKAGVNVSVVHGTLPPAAIKQMRADHAGIPKELGASASLPFVAIGLSIVIHPRNPRAPTVHANWRYFEISNPNPATEDADKQKEEGAVPLPSGEVVAWWFGGGSDLTPNYLYPEDAEHFHRTLKDVCDAHSAAFYPAFKAWCDQYFYLPHRSESRGIGGLFWDDLCDAPHSRLPLDGSPEGAPRPRSAEAIFAFIRDAGHAFLPSYLPILQRRLSEPSGERERRWQLLRRGRYVEFNLIHDRGTKFGIMTPGARIESILMSLPETARWEYMSDMGTEEGSEEAEMLDVVRKPRDWA